MQNYLNLMKDIVQQGVRQQNRTGIDSLMLPGQTLRFDLTEGFPIVTTRKVPFKGAVGEMIGFLHGYNDASLFRGNGCKFWDKNANENRVWLNNPFREGEDHLGRIYGLQWREWFAYKYVTQNSSKPFLSQINSKLEHEGWDYFELGPSAATQQCFSTKPLISARLYYKAIDQFAEAIKRIVLSPSDRRILISAWNPAELDEQALPACHFYQQWIVSQQTRELHLCVGLRSSDVLLGIPSNVIEYAFLHELVARVTGYKAKWLTLQLNDCHLYVNHLEAAQEQLQREPLSLPTLAIEGVRSDLISAQATEWEDCFNRIMAIEPQQVSLKDYKHHGLVKSAIPMAV